MTESAEDILDNAEHMSVDDLAVTLFVGKLYRLNEAGVDIGIERQTLQDVLMMINELFARLVVPPEGVPN